MKPVKIKDFGFDSEIIICENMISKNSIIYKMTVFKKLKTSSLKLIKNLH